MTAVLIALACQLQTSAQTVDELRKQALAALEGGKFTDAETILRRLIEQTPRDPGALGLLGAALDGEQRFDEAGRYYQEALKVAPGSASLWNNLGSHYLAGNDPERARDAFQHVLRLQPENQNAHLQLARIAAGRKEGAAALAHLAHLRQPSSPALDLLRAEALYWAGRRKEGMALAAAVARSGGDDPAIHFSAGLTFQRMEKFEEAESEFTRTLAIAPTEFAALHNLGLAAAKAGHLERAGRAFESALEQRPDDVDTLLELGRLRAREKAYDEAISLLGRAAAKAPGSADIQIALAHACEDAAYYGDAALAYDRYLALRPDDDKARRDRALVYARAGRLDQALKDLTSYVARYPRDPVGHYHLGLVRSSTQPDQGLEEISKAVALDPNFLPARYSRGVLFYQLGRAGEALNEFRFVTERQPDDAQALDQLGMVYLSLDQPAPAEAALRRAVALAPGDPVAMLHLGRALLSLGRQEEGYALLKKSEGARAGKTGGLQSAGMLEFLTLPAPEQRARQLEVLRKASATRPADALVKLQLGQLLLASGEHRETLDVFGELLKLRPNPRLAAAAGRALMQAEEYKLAGEFLRIAVKEDPTARLDLVLALFLSSGAEQAFAELEAVPEKERSGDFYLVKALVLEFLGKGEEAASALQEGLRSAPERPAVAHQAVQLLIRNGRTADALQLLEAALRQHAGTPELLLDRSLVLELLGRSAEADQALQDIHRRRPEWGRAYLAHGLLARAHGRAAEARRLLETAAALGEKRESSGIRAFFLGE